MPAINEKINDIGIKTSIFPDDLEKININKVVYKVINKIEEKIDITTKAIFFTTSDAVIGFFDGNISSLIDKMSLLGISIILVFFSSQLEQNLFPFSIFVPHCSQNIQSSK